MHNPPSVRKFQASPAAIQVSRIALAALFIALGVALSPFSVPVFGAKAFPVQSFLNVLGAVFLGPVYTVLAALIISLLRNATGLGTPLAYMGSMIGALLASVAYRVVLSGAKRQEQRAFFSRRRLLALWAAVVGEIIGTGILAGIIDGAFVAPVLLHRIVVFTIYVVPFLLAALVGGIAAGIVVSILWRTGIRPFGDR